MRCAGMVREVRLDSNLVLLSINEYRCTASNKDLDGEGGRRSHAHTDALFDVFDHKTMWDDYGVIPDVLVSPLTTATRLNF
jgi:hypothetical protein